MLLQLFQLLIHLFVYPSKHFRIRSIHILYVRCFREYFQNCSQFFRSNAWKSFLKKMQTIIYFCNSLRIIVNVTVIVNLGIWQQTKDSFSIIVFSTTVTRSFNHGCTHYLSCYLWILFCQMIFLNSRINVRKREVSSQ